MSFVLETVSDADASIREHAGLRRAVVRRRLAFTIACIASWAGLVALFAAALAPDGIDALDAAILIIFALYVLWPLIGFWNALAGFILMRFVRDPVGLVCPPARLVTGEEPIVGRVALALCIRNEDPARVFGNAKAILAELSATPFAGHFRLHILSDTDRPDIAALEARAAAELQAASPGRIAVAYRRRTSNDGFKAGNVRDFCEHHAGDADLMLVLDADSRMSAMRILRMVRVMEASPRLGILQSLAVGLPSMSPLARLFQFGMRLGMRSYTFGSAWWHADCGPYWGHNALLRIEPFRRHCDLPVLPGSPPHGGAILSHDQIEAVLMRSAGYEVRVLPEEGGSFEENPPDLIEHMRRDARWCRGNMQYLRLLRLPGLLPASRIQLVLAILMFLASPAFIVLLALLLVQALRHAGLEAAAWLDASASWLLLVLALVVMFAPKIASALDVLTRARERALFGGSRRFLASLAAETLFAILVTPLAAVSHTLTIGGIVLGRRANWGAQMRDAHGVPLSSAFARFWPHTLVGLAALAGLLMLGPMAALYAAPAYAGALLAVPLAMLTASPVFGRWMRQVGLCAIPEEVGPRPSAITTNMTLETLQEG
ncbi:MAG: glucosyltransferase MdoH [Xanthobacteraceae bacterium]|jgi:membrane glycosyltransferase|nr:glucosyltransferase MdoH [Xanthobacteraceae bacterium]